ncbi:1-acyl-sn-glycerol-3-phosphate acyltransferase [hydrothermal vent metagenome]|uniref:1-acyl-sn-glycerol-3-phosphate acyltransferase n=1 Tax=hydrothermal vent metagenome TaxID=652676 RepID=A0A1W1CNT8_9ZZZZ
MKIFAKIRFYYGASVISFIAAGIMVPLMMIFKDKHSKILHYWNAVMIFFMGGKIITHGVRNNSADMFVMNHQGIIDIISMEAAEDTDLRWVAKKQLFDTPWFGYLLKLPNMIEVDRENKSGLIKLLRDAKETKENSNRVIAIFPEGTRTDRQKLLNFKGGTRIISDKLNLSIQPIVITNSKLLLNEHNKTAHSATVHISYLETFTVDSEDKNWYVKMQQKMQQKIDEEYTKYGRER